MTYKHQGLIQMQERLIYAVGFLGKSIKYYRTPTCGAGVAGRMLRESTSTPCPMRCQEFPDRASDGTRLKSKVREFITCIHRPKHSSAKNNLHLSRESNWDSGNKSAHVYLRKQSAYIERLWMPSYIFCHLISFWIAGH